MIKYRNAIYVSKLEVHREIKLYTIFEDPHTILLDINHFGFNETQGIVSNLKDILEGTCIYEYEWSGMRASFESTIEKTIIEDMTVGGRVLETETTYIYNILSNRLEFMNSQNEEDILQNVIKGFETIKIEADKYRINDCFYKYKNEEIEITFLLLDTDLDMDAEIYASSLKLNSFFLNPGKNYLDH
ncbi:MAG: hypothetical protein ACJATI_002924 [Halioglobus sp.]|jgi:hypothetical protein